MDDKEIEEFNEFLKETKARNIFKQQVILKIELVRTLVAKGNSLRQIYNFLSSKGEITCSYAHFTRVYKSLTTENQKQPGEKPKQPPKQSEPVRQSKTVDVSFKPLTSLDDGITEEEMKELMEQQKRILNRRD
jgi:hypothetical protein